MTSEAAGPEWGAVGDGCQRAAPSTVSPLFSPERQTDIITAPHSGLPALVTLVRLVLARTWDAATRKCASSARSRGADQFPPERRADIHSGLAALLALLLLFPETAHAARYALVVGNNYGRGVEVPLRYAESDAARLTEVLQELGGFEAKRTQLLRSPSTKDLEAAFTQLVAQLTAEGGTSSLLLFYYSGHADGAALHLGDGDFELTHLRDLLAASGASVRVGIIDACGSGALTARDKGLAPAEPFLFSAPPELSMRGQVLLASSSASESAQESDALKGSFFTTFLISGLRGAADRGNSGRVTLDDAFRFARAQTIRATLLSRSGTQHPSYAVNLAGQDELVLTEPVKARARLVLKAEERGEFALFNSDERLVAQLYLSGGDQALLALPPGTYEVHKRGPESLRFARVELGRDQERVLPEARMDRLRYVPLARKGATPAVQLSAGWSFGVLAQPGGAPWLRVSVDVALDRWVLTPRLEGAWSVWTSPPPASVPVREGAWGAGLAFARRWERERVQARAGVALDVLGFVQTYSQQNHFALGGAASLPLGLSFRAGGNTTLTFDVEPGLLLRPSPGVRVHPFVLTTLGVQLGF